MIGAWRSLCVDAIVHTDALGTPVAVTDENRNVIERSEYEPYGLLLNRAQHDGPGFTGHVQDALTGLTYMQQRYYDPAIGRFLSVDPVTALSNPVGMFNRYDYAANNPYRFTDPDGRCYTSTGECLTNAEVDQRMTEEPSKALNMIGSPLGILSDALSNHPFRALAGAVLMVVPGGESGVAARDLGVVYRRINPHTLEAYVGKAKSFARYLARQGEHDRNLGVKHEYEILGRAEPGDALSHLEETQIRANGGLQREGGTLANQRHAMSDQRYQGFQGVFRVEGRLDSARLKRELDK